MRICKDHEFTKKYNNNYNLWEYNWLQVTAVCTNLAAFIWDFTTLKCLLVISN